VRLAVIGLLFCFWGFLAFRAVQRGDMALAGIYALVGIALTGYRLSR
jgi:hypothetical protein